jgi:hypothetical protein
MGEWFLRHCTGEPLEVKKRNPLRHRFGSYSFESLKSQWTKTGKSGDLHLTST